MRLSLFTVIAASLSQVALAATVSENFHQYWDQTELRRWLQDYGVVSTDTTTLEDLRKKVVGEWDSSVIPTLPKKWDDFPQLSEYLNALTGQKSGKTGSSVTKYVNDLWSSGLSQLGTTGGQWGEAKSWIFQSWSDSQLKTFVAKYSTSLPRPTTREKLLEEAKAQYDSAAKKLAKQPDRFYPGDWIYNTWSDSELQTLLSRVWPTKNAPKISKRQDLLTEIRRTWVVPRILANSPNAPPGLSMSVVSAVSSSMSSAWSVASEAASEMSATAASALASAQAEVKSWSESQLREWAGKNSITIPRGTNRDELVALIGKQKARLSAEASKSAQEAFGAATTNAGNAYSRATDAFWGFSGHVQNVLGLSGAQQRNEL